ncbi:collagenase [Colwellia psychrerythraea]|uniref:Microbial collagenase n=1 Tax=Colwellia psychrerythraea TaxID=28229 RepID=A0A099L3E6_COLPS|nr:collagenase [Colwellia psychrerythraea]KGJ96970.1 Microbial collagenase [Colwellia psychrerythraea]
MSNNKKAIITVLSGTFALGAYLIADSVMAGQAETPAKIQTTDNSKLASIEKILTQVHHCNKSITIRSQALSSDKIAESCKDLIAQEEKFHQIFNTLNKPVKNDNNTSLRANFYSSNAEYVKYATAHFNMPTNNGGMYLEGYPDKKGNHAEFVAYERNGGLWNLTHEYIHYLDGRFNRYGDYCNGLHDDHAGPEFCPKPNASYPHGVWWSEGVAEYIAWGKDNGKAVKVAGSKKFPLSELFNTSYNNNNDSERVYHWGYLAVRFMMENHRDEVEKSLVLSRKGDWTGYQDLMRSWSTSMDKEWFIWLDSLAANADKSAKTTP